MKRSGRTRLGQFRKGTSGNPSGLRRDARSNQQQRLDDWKNYFTGMGVMGADKRVGAGFYLHNLSFDQLKDLYLGDDLAARAVDTIPKEALRQGYDLAVSNTDDEGPAVDPAELAAAVTQKLDVLGADEYLETAGCYERAFGGGAILLGVNDGQADMTQPLNLNRARSLDWLTPLEARELMPLYAYADPRAPKYGQPEIYQLMSRAVLPSFSGNYSSTTMLVHESRLIVFPGIRVSRYQVTTTRGGWGESVLSRVYRVLRDFNTAWSSAGVLVTDFAQAVIKIQGLWEALAMDGNQAFQNRLAAMEYGRNVTNAVTIDAQDTYERQQTPMTGLPDLLEKFAVRLAAACDMPLTLLFGTSPAGLNATGESDVRFFYDRVAAFQKRKLEPALRRICEIIFRTTGSKKVPEKWHVKFRPLWQDSAKDKAAAMFTQAQADNVWIQAGVLSAEEVASSHWGKGEYDPNLTVDFDAREAQEQAAAAPVTPEDREALELPDDYVPPPGGGSAEPQKPVPAPGPAAAPDPNTRPTNTVQTQDRADGDGDVRDVADEVWDQLSEDYPRDAIEWVRKVKWEGPVFVALDDIDYTGRGAWSAAVDDGSDEGVERVKKMKKKIKKGWHKPIILIRRPGFDLLEIGDGHHRALAYYEMKMPVLAYVATTKTDEGGWDTFHARQNRSDVWSDEAREAAAAARAKGAKSNARQGIGRSAEAKAVREKSKAEKARSKEQAPAHGQGGPKSEQSHPAGSEGKQGGEHAGGKESGHGEHAGNAPGHEGGKGGGHGEGGKGHAGGHGHAGHGGKSLLKEAAKTTVEFAGPEEKE